jgi:hypothetical protein
MPRSAGSTRSDFDISPSSYSSVIRMLPRYSGSGFLGRQNDSVKSPQGMMRAAARLPRQRTPVPDPKNSDHQWKFEFPPHEWRLYPPKIPPATDIVIFLP